MKEFNKELILQEKTVVNCKTLEQAEELLKWSDSIGIKWVKEDSYLKYNFWYVFKEDGGYEIKGILYR